VLRRAVPSAESEDASSHVFSAASLTRKSVVDAGSRRSGFRSAYV